MARIIRPLLKTDQIQVVTTPTAPVILDSAYSSGLGAGERAVIKAGLGTGLPVVIDDHDAFMVACRFGLRPVGFQDFIVTLASEHQMPKNTAIDIVRTTSRQFPAMYLVHTLDMLG